VSTLLYESLTNTREVSRTGSPVALTATKATNGAQVSKPVNKLLDSVVALVPVEVLAAHAALLGLVSKSSDPAASGPVTVTITNEAWATRFWVLLLVAAVLFYAVPHRIKHGWDWWDCVRALIPAAAFAAWTMLQKATLFDAMSDWSELKRGGIAVFLALVALVFSKVTADAADDKTPAATQSGA